MKHKEDIKMAEIERRETCKFILMMPLIRI
jgi:hypothetical protein